MGLFSLAQGYLSGRLVGADAKALQKTKTHTGHNQIRLDLSDDGCCILSGCTAVLLDEPKRVALLC